MNLIQAVKSGKPLRCKGNFSMPWLTVSYNFTNQGQFFTQRSIHDHAERWESHTLSVRDMISEDWEIKSEWKCDKCSSYLVKD